ncbi:MAG TPA: MlaD family protein [Candidatus Dormibacteraeota bacterium]|nr:MlaD family protein [Candidatus Dormibacteraeota bacterium]
MSNQARVGLFTLVGLLTLLFATYVVADLGSRRGYQIGVHFKNVAGLKQGGYVLQSGVIVGSVADVTLLPDYSVEVVLSIHQDVGIPSNAEFIIRSPVTGDPYLNILLPKTVSGPPAPPLPRQILPVDQQPEGKIPVTLADLMASGQNEANRLDRMLADIERREPAILDQLQQSAQNVNVITRQTTTTVSQLSERSNAIAGELQQSLGIISGNLVAVSDSLRSTVNDKTGQVSRIVDNLTAISKSLAKTADDVQRLAGDPTVHENVVQTTTELRDTAHSVALIANDLHTLTGDRQTQAQLHDTVSHIDAAAQRLNSLLGHLGGESSVYGVDAGATPAPAGSPAPNASGQVERAPDGTGVKTSLNAAIPQPKRRLTNLASVQIRVSELAPTDRTSFGTPLLSRDQGPQSDVNFWFLPKGGTSVLLGGNDFGGYATVNAAVFRRTSPNLRVGGGLFYSRLGVAASADAGRLGFDAKLYDLRHPTFDLYGRVRVTKSIDGFVGERDIFYADRRPVYGLELNL